MDDADVNERRADLALLTYDELELLAKRILPAQVFDFIAGGAGDEWTLARNRAAFDAIRLRSRVLVNVETVATDVEILKAQLTAPLFIAPMGLQRLAHPEGEAASAAAAANLGIGFILSSGSSVPMEEVASVAGSARWFQLYWHRDRHVTADLVARASASGFTALCLTADAPVVGMRRRDARHAAAGLTMDPTVTRANLTPYGPRGLDMAQERDVTVTWKDLEWLRSLSNLPLIIKGVMTEEDTRAAIESGASGIYVSNHGGRNLDHAPSTIEVLEEVVAAAEGQAVVILDGGIRRGSDIVVALGLGASAVAVGRPAMWALAHGGAVGIQRYLASIIEDLRRVLMLIGTTSVDALSRSSITSAPWPASRDRRFSARRAQVVPASSPSDAYEW